MSKKVTRVRVKGGWSGAKNHPRSTVKTVVRATRHPGTTIKK